MTEDRRARRRTVLARVGALAGVLTMSAGCQEPQPEETRATDTGRFGDAAPRNSSMVERSGGEQPDGSETTSTSSQFETIQAALDEAMPGDDISIPPGEYHEKVETVRAGTPGDPITIAGPPSAVIRGDPDEYGIVRINHSHVHLRGVTITGLLDPSRPDDLSAYVRGQLVQTRPPTSTDRYLRDVVLAPGRIGHSRESLIGLERTVSAEIGPTTVIGLAGADYIVGDGDGHNGELLYIGTSPSNLGADWHPWTELDRTRDVRIQGVSNEAGHPHAEAVDIKEGTSDVLVEGLTDRNGGVVTTDDTPAAISFKSHGGTVRWCDVADVPVGVDFHAGIPELVYGNDVYFNRIHAVDRTPLFFDTPHVTRDRQGRIFGNWYGEESGPVKQ